MRVLLLTAGIALVLFALVGLPHLYRSPYVRSVTGFRALGLPPGVSSSRLASEFAVVTGASLTHGNAVEMLANGDGTFGRLWRDIRLARRSVTVQMYYAGAGAVADSVTRILAERARAGVRVYFLVDAFGAQTLPRRYLDTLRAAGAQVAEFRPIRWYSLDKASHRAHVRGIIVDGVVAYTGGFGFDDKWLGGGRQPTEWRETNARFSGPAVAQLQTAFISSWAEATGQLLTGEFDQIGEGPATSRLAPAGGGLAALVYSPPITGSTAAERLTALSIATARRRLHIANAYFIPDAPFVQMLVAASHRGVDVRVLTNGPQSDVSTTRRAAHSRYDALLAGGVRIFEYGPTTMHSKTLVVDGVWSTVGTMNFDNRSLAYNSEVALVTLDSAMGARMESFFLDDLRLAEEIIPAVFGRRSHTERFLERAASVMASIL